MEKKNTGLIITIIVLGLLLVGLGGFVIYDKFIASNNTKEKDNGNDNNSPKVTQLDLNRECNIIQNDCVKYLTVENKKIDVKLTKINNDNTYNLLINNVIIAEMDGTSGSVDYLEVFSDMIITVLTYSDGTTNFMAFDTKGNTVLELKDFDNNYDGMYVYFENQNDYNSDMYKLEDNKIVLFGYRLYSYLEIQSCSDIVNDDVISAVYELNYLGNNKFSEPIRISTNTLSEVMDCAW